MRRKSALVVALSAAGLMAFGALPARAGAFQELAAAAGAPDDAQIQAPAAAPRTEPLRIGYMTGVFNPVHLGHVAVVREAMRAMELDAFVVMPTPATTHNEKPLAWELRLDMARLAFASMPGVRVIAPDFRAAFEAGGTGAAILRLKSGDPQAHWVHVMGADSWQRYLERGLLEPALRGGEELLVVSREGAPDPEVEPEWSGRVSLLRMPPQGPKSQARSSTLVRQRRAQGLSIGDLVCPEVEAYILEHDLYAGG